MLQVLGVFRAVCVVKGSDWVVLIAGAKCGYRNRSVLSSPCGFRVPQSSISRRSSIVVSPEAAKSAILFLIGSVLNPESRVGTRMPGMDVTGSV